MDNVRLGVRSPPTIASETTLSSTDVTGKGRSPLKPEWKSHLVALWELSANSLKVPDAAMAIEEMIPWEWPVAPESRLRSSQDQILNKLSKPDKRERNGNRGEIGDSRVSSRT